MKPARTAPRNRVAKDVVISLSPDSLAIVNAVVEWHKRHLSDADYESPRITRSSIVAELFKQEAAKIGLVKDGSP